MNERRPVGQLNLKAGAWPVLAWTLAWGVMGVCLHISGVFNKPRTGPLWVALLGGMIPWALAGVFTFRGRSRFVTSLVWALAYLLSFGSVACLAVSLPESIFVLLLACALGPGAGAFASAMLADSSRPGRAFIVGFLWLPGFLAGTWIGFFGIYAVPELAKYILGPLIGVPAALTLGSGLGAAPGGFTASGLSLALMRLGKKFI